MKMMLNSLKIENFKAIKNLTITPNGSNLAVTGKNKLGKTSIYDGFLWLLFGKNSAGETKFTLKPTNQPPETENSVEANFTVDGKPLTLKKVYASKYVKTTGEYKGSEIECYINGVPKKIKEYEAAIAEIIDEEKFKLLTNPMYFPAIIEWKKRREILFGLVESRSDHELASENEKFACILDDLELLGDSTELLKSVAAQVKNNSERINILPKLINENTMKLTEVSRVHEDISELKKKAAENSERIGALKAWKPEDDPELTKLNQALDDLIRRNAEHRKAQEDKSRDEENKLYRESNRLVEERAAVCKSKEVCERALKTLSDTRNELLKERKAITESKWNGSSICPTCGQAIPNESLERSKAEFEKQKADKLAENREKGMEIRKQLDEVTTENNKLLEQIMSIEARLKEIPQTHKSNGIPFDLPEFEETKQELEFKIATMKAAIAGAVNPNIGEIEQLSKENAQLEDKINMISQQEAEIRRNNELKERISELKAEQVSLRGEQAKLQQKYDAANAFIRFKTDSITESINSKFKLAKFKLFEPNKTNDGLQECCDALAYGASRYNDINTAGKILVGIDIISTLSAHYGLSVPLFIDNIDGLDSESHDMLINSISGAVQLITLRVSDDETIRTEVF